VKAAQRNLPKTITWIKKSRKGRHEWERPCVERGLWPWKLKTPMNNFFASKVIMLEKVLEFKKAILLYYGW
jgi:hypothetical protein